MRKYNKTKIASVIALSAAVMSFAQSSNENYMQSKTCLNDDCSRRSETITYFDGLGRAKQIVSVKSTPTGKDLVTPVTYDGFGRQIKDILPVPADSQNSSIHTGITDESAANTYYGVSNAYSEKQLENSPLDRLLQQAAPGEAWKMSSGKTQKFTYDANLGTEVRKFGTTTTTSTVNNVSTGVSTVWVASDNSGFYPASTLYKNTVTDEDGNPVTEFKNGQGQTLLIRRNDGSQNVDTYYVYNEYNQLAFVISPKAVKQIELNNNGITDEILNELCYQYKYDGRSRLVEKKIPGKDWEFMVYDQQDRIVLTQDGKLRTTDNTFTNRGWLFTKYDELGRVAYTGFYPNTAPRPFIQNQVNNLTASSPNTEIRITNPIFLSGTNLYYRNQAFPSSGITLLTVSYYDTYPSETPAVPATVLGQPTMSQTLGSSDDASTTGMVTSSYVKNIEDNNWTKAYHYYDSMGRQIAVKTTNHLGGYINTETELDFAGVPKLSKTYHKRLNGDTERIITETFEYDNQNRLLVHKHKVDNNQEEILAQNTYNDLSQLTNKKVGGTVASSPLQSIDYLYNIRGWMTKINDPKNLGSKLFGYEIKYNTVEGLETPNLDYTGLQVKPRYNGNIAEVDWRTGTTSGDYLRRYGYVYDNLNRLSAGFYQKDSNPSAKEYFEKMDYDLNGNITNLKRSAESQQGATAFNIDDLTYTYANNNISNRLTSVTDSSTDYRGYPDTSGIAIPYDVNGNMTSHKDKGILGMAYNFLNLPNRITFDRTYLVRNVFSGTTETRNITTSYLFRADGTKLNKIYMYGVGKNQSEAYKITEYLDGFQYEGQGSSLRITRTLKFVPTAEGYYNFENNKYIYNYSDHLGNVRLSYFNNGSSVAVLEENNYYPFGMKHEGYNGLAGNSSYQYKYNGKELQTESGMYDYGARFYMADIGRWGVIDPLSEKMRRHSPYNYAFNNPIRFIDPDGRSGKDIIILTANGSFKASKDLMYKTAEGRRIWDKYGSSKTDDIYINSSVFPKNDRTMAETYTLTRKESFLNDNKISNIGKTYPSLESFEGLDISKSGDKNVHLMAFNESFFTNEVSEKYTKITNSPTLGEVKEEYDLSDLTKVVYHETKAHIEDRTGDADQDHKKFGESKFQGYITPNSPMDLFDKQLIKIIQLQNEEKYKSKK
ncbi:DUF6443 domain-containing protein [uncultured Chryseobacterium sp.]|uniref:DUF6443 domain-containing protein n=1 Tax=uncultured Chryseobacterium sp. TaxID=259322 RepID=UPI0025F927F4|nr:DUF6443 domain-containing protein [uncultured Chryseobacterium sp.]